MTAPVPEARGDKPRILIVDDEPVIRGLLRRVLERGGDYELVEAVDGVAAQQALAGGGFDVVVTDLIMPRLDGIGLIRWAKDHAPGASWIILTGRGTLDDAVEAIRLGAFDFITKPLPSPDVLAVTIRNALRQRQLEADRTRLLADVEDRNVRLGGQVRQLQEACRMLGEQAQMLDDDLRRAELIQRALLPPEPPEMGDFSAAALYRASRNVGGDLYDVLRVNDRYVIAYVADAAGHGVSAAMLAVLFKHRLHMTDEKTLAPTPPAEVLRRVNGSLVEECRGPGLFVTVGYCVIDTETRELTVASAGHPPLLLTRDGGEVEMIYHTGPALGISPDAEYGQKHFTLDPADRLLLYSDGLLESDEDAEPLTPRLIARTMARDDLPGGELLATLLEMLGQRRQGPQEDDITMLLLTASPAPSAVDNGQRVRTTIGGMEYGRKAEVLVGSNGHSTAVSITGRANWSYGAAFHDFCQVEIDAGHALVMDLSGCDYLDSTFLGTIQEVVDESEQAGVPLSIQGTLPGVSNLFEELGMERVLRHVTDQPQPLPGKMDPLTAPPPDDRTETHRVLLAHETLAALNESNRLKFAELIDTLHKEMMPKTTPS